jgi:hypothetical protein
MSEKPVLRLLRPAAEPLGLFLRPGHNDHRVVSQLLSEGRSSITGVIFDPANLSPQEELRSEVRQRNLWAIVDTRLMELATPSGHTKRRAALPWASQTPHQPQDLSGAAGGNAAGLMVEFAAKFGFNGLLIGHYLERGANDTWFAIDLVLLRELRRQLDLRGLVDVALYYTLAVPTEIFHDAKQRAVLKAGLQELDLDGLWLRIHPFGAASGHITLQRFLRACQDLHSLNLPLIVEKAGSIGLPLLAFGAVSGIETGVSSGDKFDFGRLAKQPTVGKTGFAPHARVYIPELGVFLERDVASVFFSNRSHKATYGCHNSACCRRGSTDTLIDPRRHFVITRMEEVGAISQVPAALRSTQYLETMLRPATDRLGRVIQSNIPEQIKIRLEKERRRLDGWRHTLGKISREQPVNTTSAVTPTRRASRQRARS